MIFFGIAVALLGVLGVVFRRPLSRLAARIFSASGASDGSRLPAVERVYLFGGVFMVIAGGATVFYGLAENI